MRVGLALILVLASLAGCLDSNISRSDNSKTCFDDVCTQEDRRMTCNSGDCEVCVEGDCADCEQAACEDCYEDDDCPMLQEAQGDEATPAPIPDTDVRETYDLTGFGLERVTWTADIAPGATGHVLLRAHDIATKEAVVGASVCYDWTAQGPWGAEANNQGGCNSGGANAVGVSGTTSDNPRVWIDTDDLRPGRITLAVWADPSPNELVVEIVVDNP